MSSAPPSDDPQPVPPVQPDLDDCCHSGCNPCVFDLYDEALERYAAALAQWKARQARQLADASPPVSRKARAGTHPRRKSG
ncbi:oxidoreductase-like domain-containing protein [Paraburkholderia sp. D15]|uniref:oxidoreductase-like domain-containing protein n=1 Tax=Paraburkholderia sp. D15 TaxID=2880218 RepID=UPI00247A5506|nr:oxidoreductase-like domain-containing protein [Paraburkholderia sp. D15]WGS53927.1 oxidoreductase-like domain-containing protein [Paraburkholderia sp. D15]